MKFARLLFIVAFVFSYSTTLAQPNSSLNIQHIVDVPLTCGSLPLTMIHDQLGRPYMYVAQKSGGLGIYDISNINSPSLVITIPTFSFDTLDANSITQDGNYLFVALGNFFTGAVQYSGMAIIDVTNPATATVTDFWKHASPGEGAGFVGIEGNYAYLAAMGNGLIIFDVTDKNNIAYISQFIPSINFPDPNPDPAKYNARGLEVKNDIVYLAYDAGGLRIINTTNKLNPVQTGQYSNPTLNGIPRAYNNIILDDSLVYVPIDYCGLEILNVADTSNITQTGWWNPWGCPTNNWFTSPGHTNEIAYDKNCGIVFMSTGKSEMYAVDVSNPALPDSVDVYGNTTNNQGTWGVSKYDDKLFLSYICTFGVPFPGNWPGVKILSYDNNCSTGIFENEEMDVHFYPNPTLSQLIIEDNELELNQIVILNVSGQVMLKTVSKKIDVSLFPPGVYFIRLMTKDNAIIKKFIKQ